MTIHIPSRGYSLLLTTLLVVCFSSGSFAEQSRPAFSQYPALKTYTGPRAFPDFNGRDRAHRNYRTRITEELQKQPRANFAGAFNLVEVWQTGGVNLFIVDTQTGPIVWHDGLEYTTREIAFSKNSRLLISQWNNPEQCYWEAYEITGRDLKQISNMEDGGVNSEGTCAQPFDKSYH